MRVTPPLDIGRTLIFGLTTIVVVTAGLARSADVRAAAETCGPISNGTAAGFAIDGKALCSGSGIDWYKLPGSSCLGLIDSPPGVCGTPIAGLGNTLFVQDSVGPAAGNDPTVFSGMSNTNQDLIGVGQNPWHWSAGNIPQKDDLTEVYVNVRPAAADPNGDVWLVVGAAYRSTSGDKHFDFEFNQKGLTLNPDGTITGNGTDGGRTSGTNGDIVLSIDYQQGGAAPCVHLRQWQASGGSFAYVQVNAQCPSLPGAPPRDTAFSAVSGPNSAVPCLVFANSPSEQRTDHYDALQFAEAAVNLSCYLPGFNLGSFCNTVSTVQVKTRSSGSSGFGDAQLKDFVLAPFNLSTPPVANAGPDQSQCPAASGPNTFSLSGSCSTGNCSWSPVSGPAVTFGSAGSCATTVSFTGPGVAVVRLTCNDPHGCSATDDVSLTVNAPPVASSTHTPILCHGGTSRVTVSASGGTPPYSGTGTFTVSAGSFSFTVTDANGCTATTTGNVDEPRLLTASSSPTPILCHGGTSTVTVSASGGTPPYSGTGTFTVSAGSFSFTVTDANGCTATTAGNVDEPRLLTASATHTDATCQGGLGSIDVTVNGGTPPFTYQWADGPTSRDRSGLSAGTYTLTITDADGCPATVSATIGQPSCGQIAPTNTTCSDFTSGTAGNLTALCFGLKSGTINNVAPGVFFYFTRVTSAVNGSFSVDIVQTDSPAFAFFGIMQNNQVSVFNATCGNYAASTFTITNGQVHVTINGASIGQVFIIQVKYDANSIKNENANPNTSIHYDFATFIGGTEVDADPDGLHLTNCVGGHVAGAQPAGGKLPGGGPAAAEADLDQGLEFYRPSPNPFSNDTRMAYAVAGSGERVEIGVYDLAGRRVRSLVSGFEPAGRYTLHWDGRGDDGTRVRNGVYFIHTMVADRVRTVRVAYLH